MSEQAVQKRSGWGPNLVLIIAGVLGIFGIVVWGVMDARTAAGITPGEQAPAFSMERYGGGRISLADLEGKVVMLDFWATWCPPCVEEMPYLVKLAQEYAPQGLAFVAANREDSPSAVGAFIARRVPDLGQYVAYANDQVASQYGISSLPTLYFIDRQGRIIDSHRGMLTEVQVRRRIEQALAEP